MSSNNDNGALLLILLPVGTFLAFTFWLSRSIGADFQTTLGAAMYSLLFLALIATTVWFMELKLSAAALGFGVIAWPCWWKVLESIANGGHGQIDFPFQTDMWYTSAWFKYGIEGALICILIYVISKGVQRY